MTYGLTPDDSPKLSDAVADLPRIADDVACANCGESLRGVAYSAACPACATAISDMDRIRAEKRHADPLCPSCGYNLRGLPPGGKCPECGLAMAPDSRLDSPLCIMPTPIIGRFWIGSWLATACVIIGAATTMWDKFSTAGLVYVGAMKLLVSIAFVIAVWILTPALNRREAIARGFYQRSALRHLTRWLSLGWPLAAAAALLTILYSTAAWYPQSTADAAQSFAILAGIAGVVCLAILLENLAEWTCDDWAEKCFNTTAFVLPASWLLARLLWPLPFVYGLLGLLLLASLIAFILGLMSLSGSVAMSAFHHHEYQRRMARRQERQRKHERKMERRIERMNKAQAARRHGARST